MPESSKNESLFYIITALICLAARYYLLPQVGLTDYDSVRSWQIIQEISQGNYKNLFHHASPGFFLFFSLFTPVLNGVLGYILINSFFNVGTVLLLIRFMRRHLAVPIPEAFLVGLVFGLSVFVVSTGRNLGTESVSMFLFMLMLERYYQRLLHQDARAFLQVVALLALSLTINYKFLLIIPIALTLEIIIRDKVLTFRNLILATLIFLTPFIIFGFISLQIHLPFYRFAAAVFNIKNPLTPNPAQRVGYFNLDLFFYFRYFLDFELPLLVPAIILFPAFYWRQLFNLPWRTINIYKYIFFVSYAFLSGMLLLLKAPRGLTFIYSLLYLIFYLVLRRLIPGRLLIILVLLPAVGYQIWKLKEVIYAYSETSYPAVAQYLKEKDIDKIATTVGLGLVPYAAENGLQLKTIISATDLATLKNQGYQFLLLDDYYKTANIKTFEKLEQWPVLKSWPEPSLLSPLIYLDHAEFNNLTYDQIMANQRKATRQPAQLRLIRIPE